MADPSRESAASTSEECFLHWLAGEGPGASLDFESYCRAHPEHALRLRQLYEDWKRVSAQLHAAGDSSAGGLTRTLTTRLEERYGSGVDPAIILDRAAADPGPSVDQILGRVAEHTPKGTRYTLLGVLARGGMGAILRVWDEDLRRSLAMKVILGKDAERKGRPQQVDRRALARFLEEAQVTGQLDHPGIVPVHELGLDPEGRVYFTMKLVKGRDLRSIFELVHGEREGWNETRALSVILKVCEAMAYAHAKGVVHRDLKPANVMVGSFGEVFVMDWGLARVLGREDTRDMRLAPQERGTTTLQTDRKEARHETPDSPLFTMDGDVVGTPAYMPPEQARGQVERLSARSDVYAIGAMLYHLLARAMPYVPEDARITNHMVLAMVIHGPPARLHALRRDVPPELVAIVEKAMEREPERRYSDTLALAEDLRAYLEHRVVRAYETGAVAELAKWIERNKGLASSLAATVLIAVAGLGALSYVQARERGEAERQRGIAVANEKRANEEKERADREARAARKNADDVLRLSALQELDDLLAEADVLWPAHPANIEKYEDWLKRAETLVAERTAHEAKLSEMRASALSSKEEWWKDQLEKLVDGLKSFSDPETGVLSAGVSPEHGWGIERRLQSAQELRHGFSSGAYERAWSEALPAMRAVYPGLDLAPQLGLVPIGPDPDSGFWEFGHLQTGKPAARGPDGRQVLTEDTGLVFVLLPGGPLRMGGQRSAPDAANYDPQADANESPIREAELSAFFISKYEMTQAQWLRFTGKNPSTYDPSSEMGGKRTTLLHPVEQVSWSACTETLRRLDLVLPTEAQWEYAARAGTSSVWWTGSEKEGLKGAANVADSFCKKNGGPSIWTYEEALDDGYALHAPVGTYAANAFGLHDVIGNVSEWCRDVYCDYREPMRPGDGERSVTDSELRVNRGGSFAAVAAYGRSANREFDVPSLAVPPLGLRPARELCHATRDASTPTAR